MEETIQKPVEEKKEEWKVCPKFGIIEVSKKQYEDYYHALPEWYAMAVSARTVRGNVFKYKLIAMGADMKETRKENPDCEMCQDTGTCPSEGEKKLIGDAYHISAPWVYCECFLGEMAEKFWKNR